MKFFQRKGLNQVQGKKEEAKGMKKLWLIGLACVAMALPTALFAQVETSVGTLNIGGKIKWNYAYQMESGPSKGASGQGQRWGLDGAGVETFTTSSVELDINGTVGENVSYIIELQSSIPFNMGGISTPGELAGSALGVRQAKILVTDLIPMTTVTLGTFNLPVGNYQPRATNDWDMILPPLMNMALWGNAFPGSVGGGLYGPIGLGWQATGVNFEVKPVDMLALNVSYFNGNAGNAPNIDLDLEKSWLIGLKLMPTEGAVIGVSWLSEGWQESTPARNGGIKGGTEQQRATGWVVNGGYQTDQFEISVDWMTMTAGNYTMNKYYRPRDLNWQSWQATAGVWVTDSIELLARYDWADPDTANAKRALAVGGPYSKLSKYDALTIYTLGANFRLSENAEVSANYLWIEEQGARIHNAQKPLGTAPHQTGAQQGKRQKLDNNMFLIQVQVWQ